MHSNNPEPGALRLHGALRGLAAALSTVALLSCTGGGLSSPADGSPGRVSPGTLGSSRAQPVEVGPWVRHPDTPELECEVRGYPCTGAQADPQSVERALVLMDDAWTRWQDGGATLEEVAAWLEAHPDVAWAESFDGILRFQAHGAPPLGLISPERLRLPEGGPVVPGDQQGSASPPAGRRLVPGRAPQPRSFAPASFHDLEDGGDGDAWGTQRGANVGFAAFDPWDDRAASGGGVRRPARQVVPDQVISDNSDFSVKPMKRALVLGLFDWEFSPRETSEVSGRIRIGREFKCEGCVDVRYNDFPRDGMRCTPEPDGQCLPIQQTSWRDFLGWEDFDLIHVGSHGVQKCRPNGTCVTALATGRVLSAAEGFDLVRSYTGLRRPGVEYFRIGPSSICRAAPEAGSREDQRRAGGSDPYDHWVTDPDSKAYELLCRGMLWEMVTDDFFYAVYPSGLRDKLIVLNACESFKSPHLVRHLAAGGSTTIFGWKVPIDGAVGFRVMEHFYARLFPGTFAGGDEAADRGGGARAVVAWADAVRRHYRPLPPDTTGQPRSLLRMAAPDSSSYVDKRPMELVYLLDPENGEEMRDEARLELVGVPGDGEPDSLRVNVEVHGLAEEQRLDEFRVGFRLDGQPLGTTHALNRFLDEETQAFEGTIPLGRDTRPGERVDLDVRVEIPGGGISRWLYEDLLLLGACSFTGRMTEIRIPAPRQWHVPALGEYYGHAITHGDGSLTLQIENWPETPRKVGSPEVDSFRFETSQPAAPLGTLGRVPATGGSVLIFRDDLLLNRFHTGIMRTGETGEFDLRVFREDRVAGALRIPLEAGDVQLLFEAEFDAGHFLRCGEI
jgi:hypothetical protein